MKTKIVKILFDAICKIMHIRRKKKTMSGALKQMFGYQILQYYGFNRRVKSIYKKHMHSSEYFWYDMSVADGIVSVSIAYESGYIRYLYNDKPPIYRSFITKHDMCIELRKLGITPKN